MSARECLKTSHLLHHLLCISCLSTLVNVCLLRCDFIHTNAHTKTHTHRRTHIHKHTHVSAHENINAQKRTRACTEIHYAHTHTHICSSTHKDTRIHAQKNTHTYTNPHVYLLPTTKLLPADPKANVTCHSLCAQDVLTSRGLRRLNEHTLHCLAHITHLWRNSFKTDSN